MPRVMAEQGELIVSLFWSWLAGAIYVRKITDGETDRQAYSDKLIQAAFILWPLLWCMPHLLVLYTDDSCSVALSPTERQRSLHMQNGQDLGEEPEIQKEKKRMAANPKKISQCLTGKLQIEMKFPDLYTTFRCPDLIQFVSFFPNLIAIKCRLFFF